MKQLFFIIFYSFCYLNINAQTSCLRCLHSGGPPAICDIRATENQGFTSCSCYEGCVCMTNCTPVPEEAYLNGMELKDINMMEVPKEGLFVKIDSSLNKNELDILNTTFSTITLNNNEFIIQNNLNSKYALYKVNDNEFIIYPTKEGDIVDIYDLCGKEKIFTIKLKNG